VELERYTDRAKGFVQAAQNLALRAGHQRLTPEQRAELGIGDGLIRFSAGLEHPDDLIEDLVAALEV